MLFIILIKLIKVVNIIKFYMLFKIVLKLILKLAIIFNFIIIIYNKNAALNPKIYINIK